MKKYLFLFILVIVFIFTSCGKDNDNHIVIDAGNESPASHSPAYSSDGIRDNNPLCLVVSAPEEVTVKNKVAAVDFSNASEGYIMAKYFGSNQKVKLQIIGPDEVCYTYNLKTQNYEAFPLSASNGIYKIAIYENMSGTKYSSVLSTTLDVNITNEFGPNLYPNQYCNFDINSKTVAKAKELSEGLGNDLEVVTSIYNYIVQTIVYDHEKAGNVESGYIPDVDEILDTKTGICLDYAAVMTSMLRSQKIPTRLEVGYAGSAYHAWISTYIKDIGWVNGIIKFDGTSWSLMDPTFAASTDTNTLKSFIGDGTNYKTKYIY